MVSPALSGRLVPAATSARHARGWMSLIPSSTAGGIDSAEVAREERLVPLGLLARARLTRDVDVDHILTYDDVELDTSTTIYQLRVLQDQLLATEPAGTVGPIPGIPKA